jgi:hypothetical protein
MDYGTIIFVQFGDLESGLSTEIEAIVCFVSGKIRCILVSDGKTYNLVRAASFGHGI